MCRTTATPNCGTVLAGCRIRRHRADGFHYRPGRAGGSPGNWGRFTYTGYFAALDFGDGMVTSGTTIGVITQVEEFSGGEWTVIPPSEWSEQPYADAINPTMGVNPYTGAVIASPVPTLPGQLGQGLLFNEPGQTLTFGANPLSPVTAVDGWFYTDLQIEVDYDGVATGIGPVTGTIDSGGLGGGVTTGMLPSSLSDLKVGDTLPEGTQISVYSSDGQTLIYRTVVTSGADGPVPTVWQDDLGFNTGVIPFLQGPIHFSYLPVGDGFGPDSGTATFDYAPSALLR